MVGIDISDRSIKVAEVTRSDTAVLRTVCWSPVPTGLIDRGVIKDVDGVSAKLQEALIKCSPVSVVGKKVVVSIPETQSFVRVVEIPIMPEKDIDEAIQWAIRQHIPFDLEWVYLDWQPLVSPARVAGHQQVLVGAARRDVVGPLMVVLDNLKLSIIALELEAQAVARSLLPMNEPEVRGVLVIDLGATATNVVFYDQGTMRFTTSIQQGGDDLTNVLAQTLHLEPDIAAEKKATVGVSLDVQDASITTVLREATQQMVVRIAQVVRQMMAQTDETNQIQAILLAGGSANLPGISDIFTEVFPGIPVQLGNPWTNLEQNREKAGLTLSTADALHFVTALGLALREEDEYA